MRPPPHTHEQWRTTLIDRPAPPGTLRNAVVHDRLAFDLTTLANERTLLAYVRTALALAAAGSALLAEFLGGGRTAIAIGWILIVLGASTMVVGIVRYLQVRRALYRQWRKWVSESVGQ
jgi:putative membrane protein